jgi:hypothetical protein
VASVGQASMQWGFLQCMQDMGKNFILAFGYLPTWEILTLL